jgi:hypothetical protein
MGFFNFQGQSNLALKIQNRMVVVGDGFEPSKA